MKHFKNRCLLLQLSYSQHAKAARHHPVPLCNFKLSLSLRQIFFAVDIQPVDTRPIPGGDSLNQQTDTHTHTPSSKTNVKTLY